MVYIRAVKRSGIEAGAIEQMGKFEQEGSYVPVRLYSAGRYYGR